MTWAERAVADPSLRAFVDAEIARAGIDVQSLTVELQHRNDVIASQKHRIAELERDREKKRK